MKNKINAKFLKWLPVIATAIVAGVSALAEGIGEQKTEERIDSMDERIKKLEENGES